MSSWGRESSAALQAPRRGRKGLWSILCAIVAVATVLAAASPLIIPALQHSFENLLIVTLIMAVTVWLVFPVLVLTGAVLGLIGLLRKDGNRLAAAIGLSLNLALVLLMILAIRISVGGPEAVDPVSVIILRFLGLDGTPDSTSILEETSSGA